MRSFHKIYAAVSVLVFLLGLGLLSLSRSPVSAPPAIIERQQSVQTVAQDPAPALATLSGPWYTTPPIVAVAPSKIEAPPPRADTTSMAFVGTSKDKDGSSSYFFKYNPTGLVLILKAGETKKAWTLKTVTDRSFTLLGPGGLYEVAR